MSGKWYTELDERTMLVKVELPEGFLDELASYDLAPEAVNPDGELVVKVKWAVCPLCEGRGKHVNPSIDAHGISGEEMDQDPDFREDYFSGAYDVQCDACGSPVEVTSWGNIKALYR